MCYSDSIVDGRVTVYDCTDMNQVKEFVAHSSPILKMAINSVGNLLVTSSCKGTVVRVWALPNGDKLHSFHRGVNNTYIHSLNFSIESNFVVCSTSKGSIHVF